MTDRVDINRLLVEMRTLKSQTQAFNGPASVDQVASTVRPGVKVQPTEDVPSFGDMMNQAIDKVNSVQKQSAALATRYEQGDKSVDVTDVMIASQKASVSFQSMLQVRNKLVDAYRDVMNMPM
ncbi:flagellar hook-basal body complex protein FliE [Pseudoteredinibacter isoporae]|uniref:Flagellar hook-basal body complex protein FliE n=1 Tax=Pseudoteredinibacter isoporae TaxID=570281 RepID=A0A7X0JWE5_9GAMM|nr:flagellar hook-basal body complex protein FliE [Pseudoteredinibacter isoporae]MBB6523475.1 flagellar hook-basal body complex protein FliE [Pseudoteredinibacter isoporae]NHO88984.1 flagellar hook-basal body complex protein FliE [Pseudoteredinibacter isoporae]NIB24308.1 flagellar hook-basal body complex protein FliE [Pseudoteredinibacter isoporae]